MKKKIIWGIVIIVALIVIVSFFNKKQEGTVDIGVTVALTGPLAFIGQAEQNGLILAAEEINQKGGIKGRTINLIVEDNQGQANSAVSGIQKMLSVNKVDLVFSAFTHITQAIQGTIADAGIPMIYASSFATIAESNDLFFRDYFDAENFGNILGKKIISSDVSKISYLGEKNDACEPYFLEFKRLINESGKIELVSEDRFLPDATDLRTNLLKIKNNGSDAIFTCTWRKSDLFMKQLKELGMMNFKTFQTVAPFLPNANTDEMKKLYEENGTISTWFGFIEGSLNTEQQEFFDKYKKRFGIEPISDAAFTYDDTYLIAEVIGKCIKSDNSIDNKCFSETMVKSEINGVSGKLSFNEKGVSQRDGILIKVQNGKWVLAE